MAELSGPDAHVEVEPVIGSVKPDLLVSDEHGNAYVIEVKQALGGAHFGSVAQTAAFRETAASLMPSETNVKAVLVLLGDDAQELYSAGRDYGVEVIGVPSSDPIQVARSVREAVHLGGASQVA